MQAEDIMLACWATTQWAWWSYYVDLKKAFDTIKQCSTVTSETEI